MSRPTADHWVLMVLALSSEMVPPEPVRPGPALRHRPSDKARDEWADLEAPQSIRTDQ